MWPKISQVPEHHVVKEERMLWSWSRAMLPRDRVMLVSELDQKGFLLVFALGRSCYGTVVPNPWGHLQVIWGECSLQIAPFSLENAGGRTSPCLLWGKGWPPFLPALGLQQGRMRLQRIAMVTGTFLIILVVCNDCSGRCTTKQLSKGAGISDLSRCPSSPGWGGWNLFPRKE